MFRPTFLSPVLLVALAAATFAQTPIPKRSGGAARNAPPPAAVPTQPADDSPIRGLEFPNADVRDVLAFYERWTGKKLIVDNTVIGNVNIVVKAPLSREEAIRIIEMNLLMNGFTLVPAGKDIIKVAGMGTNPRKYGIPIYSDEVALPDGEQVVTFLYKLQYADPTEVVQALTQYVVPANSQYTQLLPLPKSQSLLITENTLIIRSLLRIMREMDNPPAEVISEFIPLDRADAKDVLEKLTSIFEKKDAAPVAVAAGAPRPGARPAATPDGLPLPPDATISSTGTDSVEISAGTLSEESIIAGKIKLTADTRTNRIHVVTRPVNFPFIRKLIKEFDQNVPFGQPAERSLKFVSAGDILQVVVRAVSDPGQKEEGGGTSGSGSRPSQSSNRGTGIGGGDLFGGAGRGGLGSLGSDSSGSGRSGSMSLSESLNTGERDVVPEAVIVGNTKIIADKRANKIIVIGNNEVKNKVFALLAKLDVRAPQVAIHTVIGELNLTRNETFGINYLLHKGGQLNASGAAVVGNGNGNGTGNGTGTGTGTGTTNSLGVITFNNNTPALNLSNLLGNPTVTQIVTGGASGLSGFVTAGNAFTAIIDALESTNRFRVVSRPSVFTSNNKKATIASGEEIAVPRSINSGFAGGNVNVGSNLVTQSSIDYKTVALQLEVLPLINSEREVTLDIVQKVDEVSGSDLIDNNPVPRIATRVLQTNVSVPNEGTLVLGGLIRQRNSKNVSGIPYLSRLPVLGPLFRRTTNDKSRTELVILIRPVVSLGPCEDIDTKEREMEFFNIEPDLESTVYPSNLRKKVPAIEMSRKSPLMLRQQADCVDEGLMK